MKELAEKMKELSSAVNNAAFLIDPEKPTHIYGNIVDYLARKKQEGVLGISFDSFKFFEKMYKLGISAARDYASFSEALVRGEADAIEKVKEYLKVENNDYYSFLAEWKRLVELLPTAGLLVNDMDPYKRAAYTVNSSRKVMDQITEKIRDILADPDQDVDEKETARPIAENTGATVRPDRFFITCEQTDMKYLERVYTIAEFIISNNITLGVRKKYMNIELNEAKYSYIAKNQMLEMEMMRNIKMYKVAKNGRFPYVSLVAFVKGFANLLLISMSAYSQNSVSKDFHAKYYDIKGKTVELMNKILNMEKADMASSVALAFLRQNVLPLIHEWRNDVIQIALNLRYPHSDDLNTLGNDLLNRVKEIYRLEGAG